MRDGKRLVTIQESNVTKLRKKQRQRVKGTCTGEVVNKIQKKIRIRFEDGERRKYTE